MIDYPKLIITVSRCAAEVIRVLGRRENIEVCYESIDISRIKIDPQKSQANTTRFGNTLKHLYGQCRALAIPTRTLSDSITLPGGLKQESNTYFFWIRGSDTGYSHYAKALAKSLHIEEKIFWLSHQTEVYFDYLDVTDGFVLTSFKESLSIVTLEAAALIRSCHSIPVTRARYSGRAWGS